MTRNDIDALAGLLEAATKGPWQVNGVRGKIISGKRTYNYHGIGPDGVEIAAVWFDERTGLGFMDAKFLAALASAAPALLGAARERDALREAIRDALKECDMSQRLSFPLQLRMRALINEEGGDRG